MTDIRSTPTDEPAFVPYTVKSHPRKPAASKEIDAAKLEWMMDRAEEYQRAEARRYYGPVLPVSAPGTARSDDEGPRGPYR